MPDDVFRPRNETARSIYDAFQAEAAHRKGRTAGEWQKAEREAVWRTARDQAEMRGLPAPTMDAVQRAEMYASGSADYGAKWAYGILNEMTKVQVILSGSGQEQRSNQMNGIP